MYVPAHFNETDLGRLDWLAAHDSFGTLISSVDGAPFATHLPVLYSRDGERVILTGHWARQNPQWRTIEGQRSLFVFHGPHAYISPRWYMEPARNVPTWNYAVAHVYGGVRLIDDRVALERIVATLAARYEGDAQGSWRLAGSDPSIRAMLRGIVGFELAADAVEIKFKLNQNHPAGNVEGAIRGLRAIDSDDARQIAALMDGVATRAGAGSKTPTPGT
jgi:transcriptional regulator